MFIELTNSFIYFNVSNNKRQNEGIIFWGICNVLLRAEFRADITTVYYIVTLDIGGYVTYRQEKNIETINKLANKIYFL